VEIVRHVQVHCEKEFNHPQVDADKPRVILSRERPRWIAFRVEELPSLTQAEFNKLYQPNGFDLEWLSFRFQGIGKFSSFSSKGLWTVFSEGCMYNLWSVDIPIDSTWKISRKHLMGLIRKRVDIGRGHHWFLLNKY
jgi:hypothetical protein